MEYKRINVEKMTPVIGAEISGVDLSKPLDEDSLKEVRQALIENLVIFFRDQEMDREQHKALGRQFGALHIHPAAPSPEGHPEILVIHADEKSTYVAGNGWHSDVSCDPEPPMGSILHMHTVPPSGGDTMFANMYAAYEDLSETMKVFLGGLTAYHSSDHVYRGRYKSFGIDDSGREYPRSEHPVVRTHPESGRKGLFVNRGFTTEIKGMTGRESRALLDFLFEHMENPRYHCRFRWAANSVAFWDNRCTQHYAVWDYYPAVRHGLRVTIQGEKPV